MGCLTMKPAPPDKQKYPLSSPAQLSVTGAGVVDASTHRSSDEPNIAWHNDIVSSKSDLMYHWRRMGEIYDQ